MPINSPDLSFSDDSRGVSGVIGFVLIFAILMILLSINQAQIVPQENREIEFQHFQDVRNDLVEVRSGISTAGQVNVSQYPTVTLGTNYPTRILAVNPPPPTGTLETSPRYNISIRNETGTDPENISNVSTRFLEYRNGYHEMDIGSIWYEHSVLYLDEREKTGEIAVIEDQNLIRNNGSVRVNALQNDFRRSSTGRVTIELYPTKQSDVDFGDLSGEIIVEIPTRLNKSEYWEDNMGNFDAYNDVEEDAVEEGVHLLNLTVDVDSLKINTVGIDSAPEGKGSASQGVGPQEGDGEENTDTVQGLLYDGDARATPGSEFNKNSVVKLNLTNEFEQNLTITDIRVNKTSKNDVEYLEDNDANKEEILVETSKPGRDGWADPTYSFPPELPNTFEMDQEALILANKKAAITLTEFTKYAGFDFKPRDMTGEYIGLTVSYELENGTVEDQFYGIKA